MRIMIGHEPTTHEAIEYYAQACFFAVTRASCFVAQSDCDSMDPNRCDDIKTAIISAVIVVNITLNVTVLAVFLKYPELREDRSTLFMLSLTISDLANGCSAMPIGAAVCSCATPEAQRMTSYLPRIQQVSIIWFNINSMHSLCWMTVCKMLAITRPFRYEQLLTRNRCRAIVGCRADF